MRSFNVVRDFISYVTEKGYIMAKVRIDHLDGPVGKDLFEWV